MGTNARDLNGAISTVSRKALPPKMKLTYNNCFWLFMVGCILGVISEGLFTLWHGGHWESHVTVLWGKLNVLYGAGAVIMYIASKQLDGKKLPTRFTVFCLVGVAVEYLGAIIQERLFKAESWDYSGQPLNFANGKISFIFTVFWGILGLAFMRLIVPELEKGFLHMQTKQWKISCAVLSVFMLVNIVVSTIVLVRWGNRVTLGTEATNAFVELIDAKYNDEYMSTRFMEWIHIQ